MVCADITVDVPEVLIRDFAADPDSPYDKVLIKLNHPEWPLHLLLTSFVESLPAEAVELALRDSAFEGLYGNDERLARVWFAQHLIMERVSRARLNTLFQPPGATLPYAADCLRGVDVDSDGMVRLADFGYAGSAVTKNGFNFTVCPTTSAPNSTYWLLQSFYEQHVDGHISVRLDPFLWGPKDSFTPAMFKMFVYAAPINWDGIGRLREQHHGRMLADTPLDRGEVTEFCWEPRDDGIHFICEELPRSEYIGFEAARYLHAIYEPSTESITHLDGALRIYTAEQLDQRRGSHVRNAGKAGVRRKIFRIDEPVHRDVFSLIAQAFFVWNQDLATYFRESLPSNP